MSPHRSRYVTLSQQVLALAVVMAALVPATRVVSLDVVAVQPGPAHGARGHAASLSRLVGHPLGGRDRFAALW